jgi:glycine cleavage system H protein
MAETPSELLYLKSHEWVRVEDGIATIGITDFAQSELGDVVYVDLPTPGRVLAAGDTFGSVESVKTVSDLYSPVAGEVIEVNPALAGRPELVNEDPYGGGYLLKIRVEGDLPADLLKADEYAKLTG